MAGGRWQIRLIGLLENKTTPLYACTNAVAPDSFARLFLPVCFSPHEAMSVLLLFLNLNDLNNNNY